MIKKIYLDMDGVIANFEKRYVERYGELPGSMRDRKEWSTNWHDFIETKQFETLEYWPDAEKLLGFLATLKVPVEILTSSGGNARHDDVAAQKEVWLCKHGIPYKINVVAGRRNKAKYAQPDYVMIDDTPDVIESFVKAGGTGILYKDFGECKKLLEFFLTEA
jgi:5'(3')-deoxyribonucleotidase